MIYTVGSNDCLEKNVSSLLGSADTYNIECFCMTNVTDQKVIIVTLVEICIHVYSPECDNYYMSIL